MWSAKRFKASTASKGLIDHSVLGKKNVKSHSKGLKSIISLIFIFLLLYQQCDKKSKITVKM